MSEALVERLNAAEIALRDDRPYAAVAISEAADRIDALEREVAENKRRNAELEREIDGLRNSYWEERKAHLAAEADKARLSEALRTFESYGCPVCGGDCASANPPVMFCPMQAARVALSDSGSRWWLIPNGEPVTLDDCPEGLFLFNGYLGFMTEYATDKNDGFRQRDAYCVDSGEYFWGGTSNARERAKLIVQPMLPAAPQQGGE